MTDEVSNIYLIALAIKFSQQDYKIYSIKISVINPISKSKLRARRAIKKFFRNSRTPHILFIKVNSLFMQELS